MVVGYAPTSQHETKARHTTEGWEVLLLDNRGQLLTTTWWNMDERYYLLEEWEQ